MLTMLLALASGCVAAAAAEDVPLAAAPFYEASVARHGVFVATYNEDSCTGHITIRIPGCLDAAVSPRGLGNHTAFATAQGPDAFYIRVQGREALALGPADVVFANCTYMSRAFELRRAGRYEVAIWHLYDHYNAWSVDETAWSPYIEEYMAVVADGELLPPTHTAVLTCDRAHDEAARARLPLCTNNAHVPGRWVEIGHHRELDWAQPARRHHRRSYASTAAALAYEPDNCRTDALATPATNLTIYIVGDSHFRTLANGFAHALDPGGTGGDYHIPDIKDLPHLDHTYASNGMRVVHCAFLRPGTWLQRCAPAHLDATNAIVVTGTAAWPLSTFGTGHVVKPNEYAAGVAGVLREWGAWLDEHESRRLVFMSSTAPPLYHRHILRDSRDHRNFFRNSLYDCIAARAVAAAAHARMQFLDVFSLTHPVPHLTHDRAHYTGAVLREMVALVWQAVLAGGGRAGGAAAAACGGVP